MDIRLKTLKKLAILKNYTKTAQALHLTQPAITSHIKSLEKEFDINIFGQDKRNLKLTKQGVILLDYAHRISLLDEQLKSKIINSINEKRKYYISATLTIGEFVLPKLIGRFQKNNVNVEVIMNIENTKSVFEKLNKGAISLGLVEGFFDKTKYSYKLLEEDTLCFIVSKNNHLANSKSITINTMLKENFILREVGSGTREIFQQALINQGYSFDNINIIMEIGNLNAIVELVSQNLGVSVISKKAVEKRLLSGDVVEVLVEDLNLLREFCFVYKKDGLYMDFINKFINDVMDTI